MSTDRIPAKMLPYKKEIQEIFNHSTDNKCGVRFIVKWKNYNIVSKERTHFIITFNNGKFLLKDYLERLLITSKRRFQFMMQREASLANILKTEKTLDLAQITMDEEDPPSAA